MNIKVYCDSELVHEGSLSQFLADNDNDSWLTQECQKLNNSDTITFDEFSGTWLIEKVEGGNKMYCEHCQKDIIPEYAEYLENPETNDFDRCAVCPECENYLYNT